MIVEVHWWIKEVAEGIKRTVRGVDLITEKNIADYSEWLGEPEVMPLSDVSISDIVTIMDEVGDCGNNLDKKDEHGNIDSESQVMFAFGGTLHGVVIVPEDWGVSCIKFKKDINSKRAFRVDK